MKNKGIWVTKHETNICDSRKSNSNTNSNPKYSRLFLTAIF